MRETNLVASLKLSLYDYCFSGILFAFHTFVPIAIRVQTLLGFHGGPQGRRDGRDKSRIVFNPFAILCVSHYASGLIVLHRINYHLLSAAEARTKREAPVLAFWKRNPLVARCDTYPDAEADATAVQCARDLHCDAANNGRHGETLASRRYEAHSCLLETDFVEKFGSEDRYKKIEYGIQNIWFAFL